MKPKHFSRLERMYLHAPVNTHHYPGTEIDIGPEQTEICLPLNNDYHHALGAAHGSVYFKLLDDAAFFAAAALEEEFFVLTATLQVDFLKPVTEGKLKAIGRVVEKGNTSYTCTSELYDEQQNLIGKARGTFVRSAHQLKTAVAF